MAEPTDGAGLDATAETGSADGLLREVAGIADRERPVMLEPDDVIAGYRIVRALATGGQGRVYLARDERLQREVAIKLHLPRASAGGLEPEAGAIGRLSDPNVVTVFQIGTHEGRPFVAMEYAPGGTARTWCKPPRSARSIVELYLGAARGLAAAHAAGLVHL